MIVIERLSVLLIALGCFGIGVLVGTPQPASNPPQQAPEAVSDTNLLPPCEFEDSTHCYWDASERANGQGLDFVAP